MNTAHSTLKPCYYCDHTIDLAIDNYIRIDTLQSILGKKDQTYVHELCAAEADDKGEQDAAMEDWLDEVRYPVYYEELPDGEY